MASTPLSVRLDDEAERALAELQTDGSSRSEAIRQALLMAAEARRSRAAIHTEAELLANDPQDVELMRRVREEMEDLAAPW